MGYIKAGRRDPLTPEAFKLHTFAIVASIDSYQTPGFIPDEWLNSIKAETTLTAIELETAGLWERDEQRAGYDILDPELTNIAVMAFREEY